MHRYVIIPRKRVPIRIDWRRGFIILLGVVVLSGCQGVETNQQLTGFKGAPVISAQYAREFELGSEAQSTSVSDLPLTSEWIGLRDDSVIVNYPDRCQTLARDEYLCDGGDGKYQSYADLSERHGLEPTDTVAHFKTDDGSHHVVASNRVCVYAPRFASVRRTSQLLTSNIVSQVGGIHERLVPSERRLKSPPSKVTLDQAVEGNTTVTLRHEFHDQTRGLLVEDVDILWQTRVRMLPWEGKHRQAWDAMTWEQRAWIAEAADAAKEWESIEPVEIVIDGSTAQTTTNVGQPSDVTVYEPSDGEAKLEVLKIASSSAAISGESVEFVIQFRNVGEVAVSNVKIVDNLTTRLNYQEDTQTCTLRALFSKEPNSAGSDKLLWEVRETILPGEGGLIRFRCRVL